MLFKIILLSIFQSKDKNDKKLVKLNIITNQTVSVNTEQKNDINNKMENTKKSKTKRVCLVCSKTFENQGQLRSHMSQEHNTSTTPKIICNECGMQYQTQIDFNRHLATHSQHFNKNQKCTFCSMEFYDLSSKTRHEKEHAGLKSFRCYICGFEFTRASNLRAHLIKVHSSEIGKLVNITKSSDNKLKFEFDIGKLTHSR